MLTMAKITMDFRKIKAEDMKKFIEENHAEDKKAFKENAFVMKKPSVMVGVVDGEGKPVMYVDKFGKMKQKRKAKETSGEAKATFNLLKAKMWFFEKYNGEIVFLNPPIKKEKADKKAVADMFAEW